MKLRKMLLQIDLDSKRSLVGVVQQRVDDFGSWQFASTLLWPISNIGRFSNRVLRRTLK